MAKAKLGEAAAISDHPPNATMSTDCVIQQDMDISEQSSLTGRSMPTEVLENCLKVVDSLRNQMTDLNRSIASIKRKLQKQDTKDPAAVRALSDMDNLYSEQAMSEKRIRVCPSRCKTLVIGNTTYRSAYDFELTSQDLDNARLVLNEKQEERESAIRKLKEKFEKDSEFQCYLDDHYLLCYLRFRKFDIDKACSSLRKSLSLKNRLSEKFILPPNWEKLYNLGVINWLPYRNEEGMIISFSNFGKWKIEEMSLDDILSLAYNMLEITTMNPSCQINGVAGIYDFKGFTITAKFLASMLNPRLMWEVVSTLQDGFPGRIKYAFFVNTNVVLRKAINTFKYFMKKKIAERIHVLADESELHQFFNPAILPKTLGGKLEDDECLITGHVLDNLPYLKYLRSLENKTADTTHNSTVDI